MTDETDTTTTTTPAADPANGAEAPETDSQATDTRQDRKDAARREALRASEARVAALEARLQARDRRDAETAAAAVLQAPDELWRSGINLTDLHDDDGELDVAKVRAAAERVAAERPYLAKRQRVTDAGNLTSGPAPGKPEPTWADMLKPKRGR